jgi:large subunit ribosomal protein L9
MQIILLERVEKLGHIGEVVRVRPGYARNYLFPQKNAVRATDDNKKRFEQQRAQIEATNLERRRDAESVAGGFDGLAINLIRQAGEAGQLYGSVSARDIADAVTAAGFSIRRNQVRLELPIKTLGVHTVAVALHPEVVVKISVNVARTVEEAEAQAKGRSAPGMAAATPVEAELEAMFEDPDAMSEPDADEEGLRPEGGETA